MIDCENYGVYVINDRGYIAGKNKEVYAVDYRPGDYGYDIVSVDYKNNKVVRTKIEDPTEEQLEYALLNYILDDNHTNRNKTGYYTKDVDQIVDEYRALFAEAKENSLITTKTIFTRFGLDPKGEYWQGALNGVVKDFLQMVQGKNFVESINKYYVLRTTTGFDELMYEKDNNGNRYTLAPTMEYEYEIKCNGKTVENPTKTQLGYALLNEIIKDNYTNPSKTGMYQFDKEQIIDMFRSVMSRVKKEGMTAEKVEACFGLDYSGELMSSAVNGVIEDLLKDRENDEERV